MISLNGEMNTTNKLDPWSVILSCLLLRPDALPDSLQRRYPLPGHCLQPFLQCFCVVREQFRPVSGTGDFDVERLHRGRWG